MSLKTFLRWGQRLEVVYIDLAKIQTSSNKKIFIILKRNEYNKMSSQKSSLKKESYIQEVLGSTLFKEDPPFMKLIKGHHQQKEK